MEPMQLEVPPNAINLITSFFPFPFSFFMLHFSFVFFLFFKNIKFLIKLFEKKKTRLKYKIWGEWNIFKWNKMILKLNILTTNLHKQLELLLSTLIHLCFWTTLPSNLTLENGPISWKGFTRTGEKKPQKWVSSSKGKAKMRTHKFTFDETEYKQLLLLPSFVMFNEYWLAIIHSYTRS